MTEALVAAGPVLGAVVEEGLAALEELALAILFFLHAANTRRSPFDAARSGCGEAVDVMGVVGG